MSELRVTPGAGGVVELRIKARAENLSLARLTLAGVANGAGAPEETVADLKLAVTEACTNAIQHAYPETAADEDVVVRYTIAGGHLMIDVEDSGVGFGRPVPPMSENGNGPRVGAGQGLGLMLIRELSDQLVVASGSSGSRVTFVKSIEPES